MKDALRLDLGLMVGQRVAVRRRKREWSQSDLAKRCGCSRQSVFLCERGTMLPSWELLFRLAAAFDCEAADLLPLRREIELD